MHWQRRRQPDEVPTPTAVALSDFCRRASSPATAGEVREALSTLSEQDDFRVRDLTEGEPGARPLGPFAVIDILQGTEPALAANRQSCGYYELVRELLSAQEAAVIERIIEVPVEARQPASAGAPSGVLASPDAPSVPRGRTSKASVTERIAPKKRPAVEGAPVEAPPTDVEPIEPEFLASHGRTRELPKPRGRFSRLDMPKASLEELFAPAGKESLSRLLVQHVHRPGLLTALSTQYVGRAGAELSLSDLDAALAQHGLLDSTAAKERELILGAYEEHRGASGRVAWALDIRPSDLARWIARLGLTEQVEAARERFRREALATPGWTAKLDLLGRTKYLGDLGIAERFAASLRLDLGAKLKAAAGLSSESPAELQARVAKGLGVSTEMLARAVEKLGLHPGAEKALRASPEPPTP